MDCHCIDEKIFLEEETDLKPTPVEFVLNNSLILDRILQKFYQTELFPLRLISSAWNDSALRLLQKQKVSITLSSFALEQNDPCCFQLENTKFILTHIILELYNEPTWNKPIIELLHAFLQLHHPHIKNIAIFTGTFTGNDDFISELWNKFEFPNLERLNVSGRLELSSTSRLLTPKQSVRRLLLNGQGRESLDFLHRLIAACSGLKFLLISARIFPNVFFLPVNSLREFIISHHFYDPPIVGGQSLAEALETLKTLLFSHARSLEVFKVSFYDENVLAEEERDFIIDSPLPLLKEFAFSAPAILKNFGPITLPELKFLRLSFSKLDYTSFLQQKGGFRNLSEVSIYQATVPENRKFEQLLSMCETARKVTITPSYFRLHGHPSRVNRALFNSLKRFKNLKSLGIELGFDVQEDIENAAEIACANINEIEAQMIEIGNLTEKGLTELDIKVILIKDDDLPPNSCVSGDWGRNFLSSLVLLAKKTKKIYIEREQDGNLFSRELEEQLRGAIEESQLKLRVRWNAADLDY